ncbi:MAG: alpha/beta hydrolase [Clostridia bacterium]|nr:alpha/beta hydrolase [Clostridia bacterium]
MIESWDIQIPALTGEKTRKAYVYLPENYGNGGRFPVMYMFDGHNLFSDKEATYGKSWGLSDYLDGNKVPLIIAAVECNHEGNERLSEYSPVDFDMRGQKISGRGKKYMDWLVKTFKPYIDLHYRTLPDWENTAIGGSSMGGLMTLYALSAYKKYFSRGAALSPSLWVCKGVPDFIESTKYKAGTRLYMDYGSCEFKNHDSQRDYFAGTASALIGKNVNLTSRIVPGGTHSEASWEKQIPYFINVLFGN